MSLSGMKHNRQTAALLSRFILADRLSHAYLFVGEKAFGKELALEFSKALFCRERAGDGCGNCVACRKVDHGNHEDLIFVEPDGNSIKTEAVERIIAAISYKSLGECSIIIIDRADKMTEAAQNKLLKTLEEPSGNTVIILLAERREMLKPTIVSRCVSFYLQDGDTLADEGLLALATDFIRLCADGEAYFKKAALLEDVIRERASCLNFLDVLEDLFRSCLLSGAGVPQLIKSGTGIGVPDGLCRMDPGFIQKAVAAAEEARNALQRNYNTGYAMKWLCLRMDKRRLMEG